MRRLPPRQGAHKAVVAFALGAALVFVPVLGTTSVHADALSDAIAAQKALQQKISTQRKQIDALEAKQASLTSVLATTTRQLDAINANQQQVKTELTQASTALDAVRAQYTTLVGQVNHLDWDLTQLDAASTEGAAELAQTKTELARDLVDAYTTDQTGLLAEILSARSLTDVLAAVSYDLSAGAQDAQLAQQIAQQQASLV